MKHFTLPKDGGLIEAGLPKGILHSYEKINTEIYDEVATVENEEAFEYSKLIASREGVLVGISSGAALFAAIREAKKPENEGKTIVTLLPDSGDRYFSTPLFTE